MRIRFVTIIYQVLLLIPLFFLSCNRNSDAKQMIPPPTNPLIREFIGYGVVNISFAHVIDEPNQDGRSLANLRRGSMVKIIERQVQRNRGIPETWVLVDAQVSEESIHGWLRESSINVFNNEVQALTAAGAMNP